MSLQQAQENEQVDARYLMRFLWLSVILALVTMAIKGAAAYMTGSVGILSDALESGVNLLAALVSLWALNLSAKPADANHHFGHGKAEYFSAAVEGILIFIAASLIIVGGVERLINPQPIEAIGLGLLLTVGASVLNGLVGGLLVWQGRKHRSITLEADGRHLLTDVVTSGGVIVGIGLIWATGWHWLDPVIAIVVGVNILITGSSLVRRSAIGLLDAALPDADVEAVRNTICEITIPRGGRLGELLTRESGRQRFVQATILVPGEWSVQFAHDLTDDLEVAVERMLPGTVSVIHVEPDPDA